MKRISVALAMVAALLFGTASVASADYPPDEPEISTGGNPTPGGSVPVTVEGCEDGETVEFDLPANGDGPSSTTCTDSSASLPVELPDNCGTYQGTATLVSSDTELEFEIVVPDNLCVLPPTGSDSTNTVLWIGFGLVGAGGALALVAGYRRRASGQLA